MSYSPLFHFYLPNIPCDAIADVAVITGVPSNFFVTDMFAIGNNKATIWSSFGQFQIWSGAGGTGNNIRSMQVQNVDQFHYIGLNHITVQQNFPVSGTMYLRFANDVEPAGWKTNFLIVGQVGGG